MFRRDDGRALAMLAGVAVALLALWILWKLRDTLMKNYLRTVAMAAALAALGGCQSFDLADYASAANELDSGCYKDVDIKVVPMFVGVAVLPVVTGAYRKVCNPDQAPRASPLQVGQVIGAAPPK